MRIFAAMDFPAEVRTEIRAWQEIAKRLHSGIRWVESGQSHLTLRFLGNVGPESVDAMSAILDSWTPGPLPFSLESIGSFGGGGRPAVYWLGCAVPEPVRLLARSLGMVPDDRGRIHGGTFVPHITVGRTTAKPPAGPPSRPDPGSANPSTEGRLEFPDPPQVKGFFRTAAIYDSILTPGGPEYRTIQRFDISRTHRVADDGQSDGR